MCYRQCDYASLGRTATIDISYDCLLKKLRVWWQETCRRQEKETRWSNCGKVGSFWRRNERWMEIDGESLNIDKLFPLQPVRFCIFFSVSLKISVSSFAKMNKYIFQASFIFNFYIYFSIWYPLEKATLFNGGYDPCIITASKNLSPRHLHLLCFSRCLPHSSKPVPHRPEK